MVAASMALLFAHRLNFSVLCHDSLCHIPVAANLVTSVCPICCGAVSKGLDVVWGGSLDLPAAAEELWEQSQALHEWELRAAPNLGPGCSQVIAVWDVLLMLPRLAQSTAQVTGRGKILRGINGNALRLSEQRSKSLRNLLSEERRMRQCAPLLQDLGGDIAHIPGRSFGQVCSFRLCLLPWALHCRGWRKQACRNTRKNTLECTVSLRAFGIRSAVAFEPALWYDEIS